MIILTYLQKNVAVKFRRAAFTYINPYTLELYLTCWSKTGESNHMYIFAHCIYCQIIFQKGCNNSHFQEQYMRVFFLTSLPAVRVISVFNFHQFNQWSKNENSLVNQYFPDDH